MNCENLVAYLDGESSPQEREAVERELQSDPKAFALFRELCRQQLMLAEIGASPAAAPPVADSPRFRLRLQVVAAILLFAATITSVWLRSGAGPHVVQGTVVVAGRPVRSIPMDTLLENPGPAPARIALRKGTTVALSPASSAVLHLEPPFVELRKGTMEIREPSGTGEVRVATKNGLMIVRGSEFSVELVPGPAMGGQSMESLLALVVSVLMGNVQVDVAGKTQVVPAGESRVFGADGVMAISLSDLLAAQDEKEKKDGDKKEGEEKEKKGKKKDKKEGKEKKEKEDDDDKEEKNGKDNEKGKKD